MTWFWKPKHKAHGLRTSVGRVSAHTQGALEGLGGRIERVGNVHYVYFPPGTSAEVRPEIQHYHTPELSFSVSNGDELIIVPR